MSTGLGTQLARRLGEGAYAPLGDGGCGRGRPSRPGAARRVTQRRQEAAGKTSAGQAVQLRTPHPAPRSPRPAPRGGRWRRDRRGVQSGVREAGAHLPAC